MHGSCRSCVRRCRQPSTWRHISFTVWTPLLPRLPSCFHRLCVVHPTSRTPVVRDGRSGYRRRTRYVDESHVIYSSSGPETTLKQVDAVTLLECSCSAHCVSDCPHAAAVIHGKQRHLTLIASIPFRYDLPGLQIYTKSLSTTLTMPPFLCVTWCLT